MKVNLCFITDEYYAMPTCIAINSLLKNKNVDTVYDIYILNRGLKEETQNKLKKLTANNFNISFVKLDKIDNLNQMKINNIPATVTAIYKFFISDILSEIDKILYLDGDIIINKDLSCLYNKDLKDNYVAAVKDTNGLDYKKYSNENYNYFNSGVLLLNLKKMREDNLSKKLFEYRKNGFNKLMDQDTFNYVMKNKVLLLPFKYNTQMNTLSGVILKNQNYNIKKIINYWSLPKNQNSINKILKDSTIIHYTTAKPWKYYDGYGNDIWYKYYLDSPYKENELYRESYYINRLINSKSYRLLNKFKMLFRIFRFNKNRKYKKFLDNFFNE